MTNYKPRIKIDKELIELAIADIKNSGKLPTAKEVAYVTGYTQSQVYLCAGAQLHKQLRKKYVTKKNKKEIRGNKSTVKVVEKFSDEKSASMLASLDSDLHEILEFCPTRESDENLAADYLSKYFDTPQTVEDVINEEMEKLTELHTDFEATNFYGEFLKLEQNIRQAGTVEIRRIINKLLAEKILKTDANNRIVKVEATKPRLISPLSIPKAAEESKTPAVIPAVEAITFTRKKYLVLNPRTGEHSVVYSDNLDEQIDVMLNNMDDDLEVYELKEVAKAERKILRTKV